MRKKTNLGIIIISITMILILTACGLSSEEKELKETVEKNFEAMNKKDINQYMSMLSKDITPAVEQQTKQTMQYSFQNFDLEATMKDFKVISMEGNTAVVEVEQDTINKKAGAAFKNNRITEMHTMVKENVVLKFKSTMIQSAKQLDDSVDVIGDLN
jgi:hypothetical protein